MLRPTVAAKPIGRLLVWMSGPPPIVTSGYQALSAGVLRVRAAAMSAWLADNVGLLPRARWIRTAETGSPDGKERARTGSASGASAGRPTSVFRRARAALLAPSSLTASVL